MAKKNILTKGKKQKAANASRQGRWQEAVVLLTEVVQSDSQDAGSWMLLASANGQLGKFEDVISCCERVLALQPKHAVAYSIMGNAQTLLGQREQANTSYREALALSPDDPSILNNLGNALYLAGKTEEAVTKLQRAVQLQPGYVEAHYNLAQPLETLGRLNEAINHYEQSLRLKPDLFPARFKLAELCRETGHLKEAKEHYRKALKIKPDSEAAYLGLAVVLRYQGYLDEALITYQKINKLFPDSADAIAGIADIYERQGKSEQAYQKIRTLIDVDKIDINAVDILSRVCKKFDCCDEADTLGKQLLSSGNISKPHTQFLHYSLGKLHDKLENYDKAFEHFAQANELSDSRFDKAKETTKIDRLINAFNSNSIAKLPRSTIKSDRPIFIVGMPRSGTSLIEQILSAHPQVTGAGELNDINELIASMIGSLNDKNTYPECLKKTLNETMLNKLAERYLERLAQLSSNALRVTDKMPHNYQHLGMIALLFPKARVIHCKRNPLDTCLSIFFQSFNKIHNYATDLTNLGAFYNQYQKLMQHWQTAIDIPILEVEYEALVSNQEDITRNLIDFVDLPWDDACLEFHNTNRNVATASYAQVRQKIYTTSLARWKNYEKHIGALQKVLNI